MSELLGKAARQWADGDLEGARATYERAIEMGIGGGGTQLQLLELLDQLHDDEAVLQLADALDGRGPRPADGRVRIVLSAAIAVCRARALRRLGRIDEAVAAARDAIERVDANGGVIAGPVVMRPHDPHVELADALADAGQLAASAEAYRAAIAITPELWSLHHNLGVTLSDLGDHEAARAAALQATGLAPDHADSFYNLACYEAQLGHRDAALAALARSIDLAPDNAASARDDSDFVSLRGDPRFVELTRT